MRVGYIRVSTEDQDPQRQREAIERSYDIDRWYADVEHGDVMTGRSGFEEMISDLDKIDEIVVDEVSRLGRTLQVRRKVDQFREAGVTTDILDEGLTIPPAGESMDTGTGILWDVLTRLAEKELQQIRRRTQEGINRAMREGKHVGRAPTGYTVEDGFLVPEESELQRFEAFVAEVNRGRPKAPTAEYFGFNPDSAQTLLETSQNEDYPYEVRYVGDQEWRRRRAMEEIEAL